MTIPWRGILAVEGHRTSDGRMIGPGALSWPVLPIPLEDREGNIVGRVDRVERDGDLIRVEGEADVPVGRATGLAAYVTVQRSRYEEDGLMVVEEATLHVARMTEHPTFGHARTES